MKLKVLFISIFISLFISLSSWCQGIEGVYQVIIKKQEEKRSNRWSLADWLVTKQKIALMDQWLALHSSSTWFEFFLEGTVGDLDAFQSNALGLTTTSASRYQVATYVKALGAQYIKENLPGFQKNSMIQGNLILLGTSAQSTNIQLHYGGRTLKTSFGEFKPTYWGASVNLYLLSFLGGSYEYRKFSEKGNYKGGSRAEYGAFLDLWFLRLKGTYFKERSSYIRSSVGDYGHHISGWWLGAQLFF